MEDEKLTTIILQVLHRIPNYISVQNNILIPLKIEIDDVQIMLIRKRLVLEGLIVEKDPDSIKSLIKITPEGYQAIDVFEDYLSYKQHKKQGVTLQREFDVLNIKYLRLKSISISITIMATIISFMSGVLLSDPIKEWLHKL